MVSYISVLCISAFHIQLHELQSRLQTLLLDLMNNTQENSKGKRKIIEI